MAKIRRKKPLSDYEQQCLNTIAYMQKANIVVFNARIAVLREPPEEVTKGGIIIPEQGKRKIPKGTVVGIGLGVDVSDDDDVAGFRVGDKVMYTKYNPTLFGITLPTGEEVQLELMHVSDLYIGWRTP